MRKSSEAKQENDFLFRPHSADRASEGYEPFEVIVLSILLLLLAFGNRKSHFLMITEGGSTKCCRLLVITKPQRQAQQGGAAKALKLRKYNSAFLFAYHTAAKKQRADPRMITACVIF